MFDKGAQANEMVNMAPKDNYYFPDDLESVRMVVEWIGKQQGITCDLDVILYCFDERVSSLFHASVLKHFC